MQVQHEASLIDAGPSRLSNHSIKSLDSYCLQLQLSNSMSPIEHMATSPSGSSTSLLACHMSQSNQVLLFDMKTRKKRDKFPLKAYDKKYSRQSFQVSGIDFSPDGQRLAVGQTDCIIYIYKLSPPQVSSSSNTMTNSSTVSTSNKVDDQPMGGLKPTITGKFAASSPITCMRWCELGIIFGSQDGRVRLILSFNKPPVQASLVQSASPGDPLGQATAPSSLNQPHASSSQPPKVISIFSAPKKGFMPISLSYRNSILVVGQSDCSVTIMQLASGGPSTFANDSATQAASTSSADQSSQLSTGATTLGDNLGGPVPGRRNSSLVGQNLGVLSSTSFNHSCPPVHLVIIQTSQSTTICCSGSDGRISFHLVNLQQATQIKSIASQPLQAIELNEDIMSMDYSNINEVLALATRNRLVFVKYDQETSSWRLQSSAIELRNVFMLATIRWLRDGSQLAVGCSNNSLELFRCVWSKQSINDKLDICHIARNRIRITDRERNLLATYKTQADIKRVNLLDHGQSVLIHTTNTLLLARLGNQRLQSEIKWTQPGADQKTNMKFLFDLGTSFVIIYDEQTNELSLLKLGNDFVSFSVRFPPEQTVKRDWLSLGQFPPAGQQLTPSSLSPPNYAKLSSRNNSASNQRSQQQPRNSSLTGLNATGTNSSQPDELASFDQTPVNLASGNSSLYERFAYVTGGYTLNVVDLLNSNQVVYSEKFPQLIEWLKFSRTSHYLVFKCVGGELNLLKIQINQGDESSRVQVEKSSLLERCEGHAFWLPGSDSLIAQSGPMIHLWYDLDHRERRETRETYDSRTFNLLNRGPLIDLSFLRQQQHGATYPVLERITSNGPNLQVILSNSQAVTLSRLKTSFYAKLASDLLEAALDLLDSQHQTGASKTEPVGPSSSLRPLYSKLGWLALEREGKCELAWKVFTSLRYKNLVKYLEKCLAAKEDDECELLLSKLRGDWAKFETLARDQEEIVATYRRLNKWSLLIDYLARKQQFRQRDLAQHDHLEWLIKAGRKREAAELKVRDSGDLVGAIELLLASKDLGAAADLLLKEQKLPLDDGRDKHGSANLTQSERKLRGLVEVEIRDKLAENARQRGRAAEISERILCEHNKALELYLKSADFQAALDLVDRQPEMRNQTGEIELRYANHLRDQFFKDPLKVSKKQAMKSIDLYSKVGLPLEALKMANILREPQKGYKVVTESRQELEALKRDNGDNAEMREELLNECRKLGWLFMSTKPLEASPARVDGSESGQEITRQALEVFQVCEDYEQVVEMLIWLCDFKQAFKVCLEHVNNQDRRRTEAQFIELARMCGQSRERAWQAEELYLLMNKVELAIEMYERLGEHDKMLELVQRHQADQLESKLLQLAKWLESNNRLEEAEKYLLRASPSEWTNVVRMYRLAERWPDAYRVARSNCISERDPLLVQLAYWWARSLQATPDGESKGDVNDARCELLRELNVFKQVVEFCCETKNFPFALELLGGVCENEPSGESERVKREVVLRYATFLEQQDKFEQAESLLVQNNLIELAVKMYTDNEDYTAAIRLIEDQINMENDNDRTKITNQGTEHNRTAHQEQLDRLLNTTLVECARRLIEGLTPANNRGSNLMSRAQMGVANSSQVAPVSSKLQTAQQMFLRAQRPELAIEMYQSLGMWREAIMVAQRFAPRLLESVERALDEQVSDDIEPILRQTPSRAADRGLSLGQRELVDAPIDQPHPSNINHTEKGLSSMSEETRVWHQFESCLDQKDQKAARAHLDTYLGVLLKLNARECISARQLRPLEKFLLEMRQQRSALASAIVSQGGLPNKLLMLTDEVFGSEIGWSGSTERPIADVRAIWTSLRNILSSYAKLATGSPMPADEPAIERRVLVAHFLTLHCSLVECLATKQGQSAGSLLTIKQVVALRASSNSAPRLDDIMDLLAKLSFSLLRYADLLEVTQLLWVAGLWQLGQNRGQAARLVWSTLVELSDHLQSSDQPSSGRRESRQLASELISAKLGPYVDLPESVRLETQRSKSLPAQRLNQVRQWLLESLIEGGLIERPPMLPHNWASLVQSDQDKSSLSRACRVCGLPVLGNQRGARQSQASASSSGTPLLDQTTNTLRREELFKLIGLCEIKSDKTAAVADGAGRSNIAEQLEGLIGEIGARRRRRGQKPKSRQLTPQDHLNEIVEFILDSA